VFFEQNAAFFVLGKEFLLRFYGQLSCDRSAVGLIAEKLPHMAERGED
jgi:hypothetical protein